MAVKRLTWIDFTKAFGAMFVICLHIPTYPIIKGIINSFVLPMFFILSGMTFSPKEESIFSFIKKKARTLIWPSFILFGVLNMIIESACSVIMNISHKISPINIVFGIMLQLRGGYEFGAWFLTCLFTSEIIMFILTKYLIKNKKHIFLWMFLFYTLGHLYSCYVHEALPWSLDVVIMAVFCLLLGYLLKEVNIINKITNWCMFAIYVGLFIIGNYIMIIRNERISLYLGDYGNPIIALFTILGGTGIIITICMHMKENKILQFIGINSLVIYCLQYSVIYILNNILDISNLLLSTIVYFVCTLTGTMLMAYVLKRYCPFLVGGKIK